MSYVFAFTLCSEADLSGCSIFSDKGELVGRVLKKRESCYGTRFSYDIESTESLYEKIESGEIRLYGIESYDVRCCNTRYTRANA